jgi:hypothetical protein
MKKTMIPKRKKMRMRRRIKLRSLRKVGRVIGKVVMMIRRMMY